MDEELIKRETERIAKEYPDALFQWYTSALLELAARPHSVFSHHTFNARKAISLIDDEEAWRRTDDMVRDDITHSAPIKFRVPVLYMENEKGKVQ